METLHRRLSFNQKSYIKDLQPCQYSLTEIKVFPFWERGKMCYVIWSRLSLY